MYSVPGALLSMCGRQICNLYLNIKLRKRSSLQQIKSILFLNFVEITN